MPDRGGMGLECAPLGLGRVAMPRRGRLDPLVVATTALREGAISVVDHTGVCVGGPTQIGDIQSPTSDVLHAS